VSETGPLPLAVHNEPDVAAHVHEVKVTPGAGASSTDRPATLLGPVLETVTV
jgi:hypothetical protein